MNCRKKSNLAALSLLAIACGLGLPGAQAQQSASSTRAGASATRSRATADPTTANRPSTIGGSSSWTAGKASFGSAGANQAGGVWRTAPGLSTASVATRSTAPTPPSAATPATARSAVNPLPPSNAPAPESLSSKPTGFRPSSLPGTTRVFGSAAGPGSAAGTSHAGTAPVSRGSLSRPSGMGHAARGTQGRLGSQARPGSQRRAGSQGRFSSQQRGIGRLETGMASGRRSGTQQGDSKRKRGSTSPLYSTPDMRMGSTLDTGAKQSLPGTLPNPEGR
jgi:hypothetical protein